MSRSLLFVVTLQLLAQCIAGAPADLPKLDDISPDSDHNGFYTWTCSCSNAARLHHELPSYCDKIGGRVLSRHCVYSARDDRKYPTGFTDEACEAKYGEGFRGSCTRQGGKDWSVCGQDYGCPVIDSPYTECKAPNDVYTPCTYVTCAEGLLTCDGGCYSGKCQCGTDGTWSLTEPFRLTCSIA